jgi:hypothetical protein
MTETEKRAEGQRTKTEDKATYCGQNLGNYCRTQEVRYACFTVCGEGSERGVNHEQCIIESAVRMDVASRS